MTTETQGDRGKVRPLSATQLRLLQQVQRATDGETPLQRSGEATVRGLCLRGPTIASLVRRGLAVYGGMCAEIDGDGFGRSGNDDAPWYAITAEGRAALATKGAA
jgi:hypothetical protein